MYLVCSFSLSTWCIQWGIHIPPTCSLQVCNVFVYQMAFGQGPPDIFWVSWEILCLTIVSLLIFSSASNLDPLFQLQSSSSLHPVYMECAHQQEQTSYLCLTKPSHALFLKIPSHNNMVSTWWTTFHLGFLSAMLWNFILTISFSSWRHLVTLSCTYSICFNLASTVGMHCLVNGIGHTFDWNLILPWMGILPLKCDCYCCRTMWPVVVGSPGCLLNNRQSVRHIAQLLY